MKDWHVVVNPYAGGGKVAGLWPTIALQLENELVSFTHEICDSTQDAVNSVTASLDAGIRQFIAVGGDGTLSILINSIYGQNRVAPNEVTVAIIPVGTGNDWVRTHQIPKSVKDAVSFINNGNTVLHDVGRIRIEINSILETRYFINLSSMGFGGFVVERIESISAGIQKGTMTYVRGLLQALFKYRETQMSLILDDKKIEGVFLNVNAGICNYCGGGMKMTPGARFDDGWIDITIVHRIGKAEVIWNIPRLYNGSFTRNKRISQHRVKKLSLVSGAGIPIEADGEFLGYTNADIDLAEEKIRVIIP